MLRDILVKYYYKPNGYDYSCAEAMMHALNDYYDLKLPQEMFLAASPFSGGCWHDEMCGGLASALAVIGLLYSREGHAHTSAEMKAIEAELFAAFEEKYGCSRCKYLKERYHTPERKCEAVLVGCADILEELLGRHEVINRR